MNNITKTQADTIKLAVDSINLIGNTFRQAYNTVERADEFAIKFAEWICKHYETDAIVFGILDTKELLEIFKKEKGL